jgi:hypothetical protein
MLAHTEVARAIPGWAHAKEFGATRAQGPLGHPNQLARLGRVQRFVEMLRQRLLEPDHDAGVAAFGRAVSAHAGAGQAGDQRLDQTLLDGLSELVRTFGFAELRRFETAYRAAFGETNVPRGRGSSTRKIRCFCIAAGEPRCLGFKRGRALLVR